MASGSAFTAFSGARGNEHANRQEPLCGETRQARLYSGLMFGAVVAGGKSFQLVLVSRTPDIHKISFRMPCRDISMKGSISLICRHNLKESIILQFNTEYSMKSPMCFTEG